MDDDDVFSTSRSPSPSRSEESHTITGFSEPSDIPRLRSQHSTVGYREGISVAKAGGVQEGFDEGYSLGAAMGMRVGFLQAALVGLCDLLATSTSEERLSGVDDSWRVGQQEISRIESLVRRSKLELDTRKVYAMEFLGDDAVWKWEVTDKEGRILEDTNESFTFEEVADSHPLIRKWNQIVLAEANKLGLNLDIFERVDDHANNTQESS
ncbi:MAG: Essential protein Yae1, N terminal [Chaenotheca gracillima]|nr:MAG: Essential protein Yae1, N terminal [Chaenotheca gracillima]